MKTTKLFIMVAALICATTAWAQTKVATDDELRTAIQTDGANITVTADIDLSNSTLSIESGKTVTIDLNGHKLDRKLTKRGEGGGQVITVRNGGTLNLSNGTLKGGWGGAGGALVNEGGTVTLTSVTCSNNVADDRGGGICNREGGTLTMTGGVITDNSSNDHSGAKGGGGLFNEENATATLTGVTITGNKAKLTGGGGICNFGTLTLDGCTIQNNKANTEGGGIWEEGTLNMSGANTITDNNAAGNKSNNLFLKEREVVTVTGSLAGSTIGINMESGMGVFTSGYNAHNRDVDPATIFQPEWPEVMAVTLENKEAKLGSSLAEGDYYYIDNHWSDGKLTYETKILHPGEYKLIKPGYYEDTDLNMSGTYVVTTNDKGYKCHYDGIAYVTANTKIILCDGAKLEINGCLFVAENNVILDVYGQVNNTGVLQAHGDKTHYGENYPGIGSGKDDVTDMYFHGGHIIAKGENSYAGIGAGHIGENNSKIYFYNANVEATGGTGGAGIGTWEVAKEYDDLEVYIYGGTIKAWGGSGFGDKYAAGIGGGYDAPGIKLFVYGGEVYAYGAANAAGIGGGWDGDGGRTEVRGGLVKAYGGENGAGIGSGSNEWMIDNIPPSARKLKIFGGEVYAYGGVDAAGVGGGEDCDGGTLEVYGGYLYAEGNDNGAGIGGGEDGEGSWVTIYGGTVVAKTTGTDEGSRAIGPGDGNDDYRTLDIGDDMMVTSERKFTAAERKNACWYRTQVRVEPCDHQDATASVKDGSTHNVDCNYCKADSATHTFGDDGQCDVCQLIRLEDEGDNSALFTNWADGDTHDFFLSGRELIPHEDGSSRAYTVCLPFDMDLTGRDDLMVYTLSYIKDGSEMVFTQTAKKIEAGKPYLIVMHKGELELLSRSKLTTAADEGVRVYDWTNKEQPLGWWRGTLTKIESGDAAAMMAYALQDEGDFRRIRPDTPYAWWGAFRSMYCPDELPATNRFTINKGTMGGFTDLPVIVTLEGDAGAWYDLQGRRIANSQKPKAKGLYINNGRKTVIK